MTTEQLSHTEQQSRTKQGVILAILAYTMWGIAPIYFKALEGISALEVLSHRIIWSVVFLAILLHSARRWKSVVSVIRNKRNLRYLVATSLLVCTNWLVFIWSVANDHMLQASLGYYINPLINVLFGFLFLSERLRRLQLVAVILAFVGVLIQILAFGQVPWISLILATSFSLYGLLRKKVNLDAQTGLFIETLIMLPAATIYLALIASSDTASLINNSWQLNLLLVSAGLVTTLPLLCFNGAATRIMLSTLGFFQYIGPSLMFLLAIFVYGEELSNDKSITFLFIWAALALFFVEALATNKANGK